MTRGELRRHLGLDLGAAGKLELLVVAEHGHKLLEAQVPSGVGEHHECRD